MTKASDGLFLKFERLYQDLDDGLLKFLATFDLINLEKVTKTAPTIRLGKNPTKDQIIAKIIDYDLKHKYFLCKQLYYNGATYSENASYEGMKEQIADLQREA